MTHEVELQKALREFEPVTSAIADPELRAHVIRLLSAEILSRLALEEIRLEPYEQPDYEEPATDMWESLAQPVRSCLVALLELKATLLDFAPRPTAESDDAEITFDLVDRATPVERLRDSLGESVDAWVEATIESVSGMKRQETPAELREEVRAAIGPLADIIVSEIQRFSQRLRNPSVVNDRWNLLADLQEFRGKFRKLLGAMRFGLLHPFTRLPEQELLKEYRTELQTAQTLRRAVIGLTRDVTELVEAFRAGNPEEQRFVLEELLVRLMRFSRSDAFLVLRAPDKRVLIEFRKSLAVHVGMSRERARVVEHLLEGFVKFLDVLTAINRREVLVRHDRDALADLRAKTLMIEEVMDLDLVSAQNMMNELRQQALSLYGRETMLDDFLNAAVQTEERGDLQALLAWIKRALQRVPL